MQYLLTLLILSISSVAMADSTCTDVLEDEIYECTLFDADENEIAAGCFTFDESPSGGLLDGTLVAKGPDGQGGEITVVTEWQCGCGISDPEEIVMCYGIGPTNFPFTAVLAGEVDGDDLEYDSIGITIITGPASTVVCEKDATCVDPS